MGCVSTKQCAGIIRFIYYIFEFNRYINSEWQFLCCDNNAFSKRYDWFPKNIRVLFLRSFK